MTSRSTPPALWRQTTGRGVGVAVIDTGITGNLPDFQSSRWDSTSRVVASAVASTPTPHRRRHLRPRHRGRGPGRRQRPQPRLPATRSGTSTPAAPPTPTSISIKVANDDGQATTLDAHLRPAVRRRPQGRLQHPRHQHVVPARTDAESYKTDPLDAAAEQAWFDGITVVAAAGNRGTASDAVSYAPGNDPYVITVGAVDDQATATTPTTTVASWSSQGTTQDGFAKPDVVAPGRPHRRPRWRPNSDFASLCPTCVVGGSYFQVSGTSLAAPIVAGVAADLHRGASQLDPGHGQGRARQHRHTAAGRWRRDQRGAADWANGGQLTADQGLTPNTLIDPDTGGIDYNAASWSAGSWSTAADPLAASWSAASGAADCSPGIGADNVVAAVTAATAVAWTRPQPAGARLAGPRCGASDERDHPTKTKTFSQMRSKLPRLSARHGCRAVRSPSGCSAPDWWRAEPRC